ncbi:MAG: MBL fold metallo-hydrolase [Spirochaetae bacterium HGW-Spirochaetae-5]|nr:MAG: MBL fold metallo-hydrolase [Spirochaetae bacterium HGW-Spirochaetae-5]
MKAIFLGTNGWFETETGNTLCVLIKTAEYDIVFDAGSGFFKLDKFIDGTKPVYLFLSHFHMDHISGLHGLSKINCKNGLFIAGQSGTRDVINHFVNKPFTVPLNELKYTAEILELPADKDMIPFELDFLPLLHSDPCLGYRITVDGGTVAFCTDTGYCENAVKLARDADLLITECAFLPGEENTEWPHLNPETAARIALEAGAKKLLLTHFDAARYTNFEMRRDAEIVAREVFPCTSASADLMDLEV